MDQLNTYLLVSAILFSLGVFGVMTRRNGIAVLMGVELILNAANINFVAFSRFGGHSTSETPGPIPNPAVKRCRANGTASQDVGE